MQLDIWFLFAAVDNPGVELFEPLSRRVTSRCNLFASKSTFASHTDVRGVRADPRCARRETSLRARYAPPLHVANQDDDTSINHSRQRPSRSTLFRRNLRGDTVGRNTALGQYQVDTSIESPAEMLVNNGIIRMECFARGAHYTGYPPSALSINVGSIRH